MLTLLDQLDKGTLWQSPGGIHPPELKNLSNSTPIATIPLADEYLVPIPLVGECCTLAVSVGDKVLKGQVLTKGTSPAHLPVHAPTSGVISAIETRPSNHASMLPVMTCVITPDGDDTWIALSPARLEDLSADDIVNRVRQAGIAGMGGAAFPSHIKLSPASEIDLVIINGVECEPYITADDRLMREFGDGILTGIGIIHHVLTPKRIVIAVEDNKPEAIEALTQAIHRSSLPAGAIRVTAIPTKYPSGGEKQLIQIITGKEVPSGAIPAQLGILVHNVGTAYAIAQAVLDGKPLIERVVTVTGKSVTKPANYWVPIGTPVAHLLTSTGFSPAPNQKIIVGGPMMGHALARTQVPILKGTNCILAPNGDEIGDTPDEKACIRCGECAVACPALLLPQQLFWHAKAQEYDKAASFNLKDCIECGCCSYVCPSDIPLVEYYRIAKSALKQEAEEKRQAERAKQRFEARLQRLEDEKLAREAKAKEAAARRQASMTTTDKNAVAEAMARIQAKKAADKAEEASGTNLDTCANTEQQSASGNIAPVTKSATDKKDQVAAAIARAKAKKAALANSDGALDTAKSAEHAEASHSHAAPLDTQDTSIDDKKAKVAAAVARAKAKKAGLSVSAASAGASDTVESMPSAQTSANEPSQTVQTDTNAVDDKKAKVAAAVARAKAKKAAQSSQTSTALETDTDTDTDTSVQPPVTANSDVEISSAAEQNSLPSTAIDDKKARIAAAVAKAKAKKQAEKAAQEEKE